MPDHTNNSNAPVQNEISAPIVANPFQLRPEPPASSVVVQSQPLESHHSPFGFTIVTAADGPKDWHTDLLCGWTENGESCLAVYFCAPCYIYAHAELVGWNGYLTSTLFCLLYIPTVWAYAIYGMPCFTFSCCIHAVLRRKIRERYEIAGDKCADCGDTAFLTPCAISQEAAEIKFHGELSYTPKCC